MIQITDNGIGRSLSHELKSKSGNRNKSYGIDITEQRIKYFNPTNKVLISDLFDDGQKPAGTEVSIYLFKSNQ